MPLLTQYWFFFCVFVDLKSGSNAATQSCLIFIVKFLCKKKKIMNNLKVLTLLYKEGAKDMSDPWCLLFDGLHVFKPLLVFHSWQTSHAVYFESSPRHPSFCVKYNQSCLNVIRDWCATWILKYDRCSCYTDFFPRELYNTKPTYSMWHVLRILSGDGSKCFWSERFCID